MSPFDPDYPRALLALPSCPSMTVEGPTLFPPTTPFVAFVGSRDATKPAIAKAGELAAACARAGLIVVSGGAKGIDAAAHRGALEAGGQTWAVLGTGCNHTYPKDHGPLYDAIVENDGTLLWPFKPDASPKAHNFTSRNRVIVALVPVVVVVQARRLKSGTFNAAARARLLRRRVVVVPDPSPGTQELIARGAFVLDDASELVRVVQKSYPSPLPLPELSGDAAIVWNTCDFEPLHRDVIVRRTRLTVAAATTALLTLALGGVLVEGPDGFFRRVRRREP